MKRLLTLSIICISALLCVATAAYADEECNHNWSEWTIINEPTCSEEGLQSHQCALCEAYEEEVIPATGNHQWSEWETVTGATVFRTGTRMHYCLNCFTEETGVIGKLSPFARFTQGKYTLYKGGKKQMKSVLSIASGDSVKKWKTSKKSVVSITKSGKIKAKKKGKAKITVILKSGKKATCTIKVKAKKKKSSGGSVYITRTGIRYHCDKNCWGLRNARAIYKVSLSTAKKKGLTKCHVCY